MWDVCVCVCVFDQMSACGKLFVFVGFWQVLCSRPRRKLEFRLSVMYRTPNMESIGFVAAPGKNINVGTLALFVFDYLNRFVLTTDYNLLVVILCPPLLYTYTHNNTKHL